MSDADDWRRTRKSRGRRSGGGEEFPGDDGGWSPPVSAVPPGGDRRASAPDDSGLAVGAVATRFDAARGFGFVALDGGGGDAFLHVSMLQRAGSDTLASGTRLRVRVGQGQKGAQVTEVLEIGEQDAAPPLRSDRPLAAASQTGEEVRGTVKWYSAEKGFGFVALDDGGRDVFVHASALERSDVAPLAEGQSVTLRVVEGRKGPEAEMVRSA